MKQHVAVMMPFGGEDELGTRRAILNSQRLKHVNPSPPGNPGTYTRNQISYQ